MKILKYKLTLLLICLLNIVTLKAVIIDGKYCME